MQGMEEREWGVGEMIVFVMCGYVYVCMYMCMCICVCVCMCVSSSEIKLVPNNNE